MNSTDNTNEVINEVNRLIISSPYLNKELGIAILKKFHGIQNDYIRATLITKLKETLRTEGLDRGNYEEVKKYAEKKAKMSTKTMLNSVNESEPNTEVKQMNISKSMREKLGKELNIKSLIPGVSYRGGIARLIGATLLGYKPSKLEQESIHDADLIVDAFVCSTSREEIVEYYNASSNGVKSVSTIDTEKEVTMVDLGMNQVLVSGDTLYYTSNFSDYCSSKLTKIVDGGINEFGIKSYKAEQIEVFNSSRIERAIKFLIEGKLQGLKIEEFYLNKKNLEALGFDKSLLVNVRRFMSKNTGENGDLKNIKLLFKLSDILIQLGYITKPSEIYDLLLSIKNKTRFTTGGNDSTLGFDARRKLEKLINATYLEIEGYEGRSKNIIQNLDLTNQTPTILKLSKKRKMSESLKTKYNSFKDMWFA